MKSIKKPIYKRWWPWIIVLFIVIAIFGKSADTVPIVGITPIALTTVVVTSTPIPTPIFSWESAELTPQNVKLAVKNSHWNRSVDLSDKSVEKITVTDGSIIDIYIKLSQNYGADDELMQVGNTMVVVAEILFRNPAVKSIGVWGNAVYSDQYGNDVNDLAAKLIWDRENAAPVNYKNFRDMTLIDFKRPFQIAYAYSVHPATYKALSEDDKDGLPMIK